MSLIVEDGTGKPDAESLASVAFADAYHAFGSGEEIALGAMAAGATAAEAVQIAIQFDTSSDGDVTQLPSQP